MGGVTPTRQGEILTFYSYKGGTGRTMAVVNLAVLAAEQNKRVLVIDFDLEAPGLHRYLPPVDDALVQEPEGVLDLFAALFHRLHARFPQPSDYHPDHAPTQQAMRSVLRKLLGSSRFGYRSKAARAEVPWTIDVLHAGVLDASYGDRTRQMDWSALYQRFSEVFEQLREEWRARYDLVLIDSRTGIADIASLSTVVLPDKLVLVFTPNRQSMEGVVSFGAQSVKLAAALPVSRELPLFPLMSRVEPAESLLQEEWMKRAAKVFAPLCAPEDREDLMLRYFQQVHIPHNSFLAYGERTAVLESSAEIFGSPAQAFRAFAECLTSPTLREWLLRASVLPRVGARAVALMVSESSAIHLPDAVSGTFLDQVQVTFDRALLRALRADATHDAPGWASPLSMLREALGRIEGHHPAQLHVYSLTPYPIAVALGRMLDEALRGVQLFLYQLDPQDQGWWLFSGPSSTGLPSIDPYLAEDERLPLRSAGRGVIVAVEGVRPASMASLETLVDEQGARGVVRLQQREATPIVGPQQAKGAIGRLRLLLVRLQRELPGEPLLLVFTAPSALAIEAGRILSPSVAGSVVVCQYVPSLDRLVPTLDVSKLQTAVEQV